MSVRTVQLILEARDQGASTAIQQVRGGMQGMGGDLRQVHTTALRVASALGLAFGAREVIGFLLQTNREAERLKAQLRTFDGSRAAAVFKDIERFASKTPFQIEETTAAYIRLRSMGLNPTEETMTAFGDTAAAMGKGMLQWSEAVADAVTGEFERLKEFGIKANSEGDRVTLSFRGRSVTVRKNAAEISAALEGIGRSEFAGAMAEQMDTLNGAISNLQDNLGTLALTIGEAGLNDLIKAGVGEIRDWTGAIAENKDEINRWVHITIEGVGFAVEAFLLIPRVATDSIQAVSAAAVTASELVKRKVNFDIGVVNGIIDILEERLPQTTRLFERLTGIEDLAGLKIEPLQVEDLRDTFEASMSGVGEEARQSIDRLRSLAEAWWDIAIAASSAGAAQEEAAGDGLGGGDDGTSGQRGRRGSRGLGLTNTSAAVQAIFETRPATPRFDAPLFEAAKPGPFADERSMARIFGFEGLNPFLAQTEQINTAVVDSYAWMAESTERDLERMRLATEAFADGVTASIQYGVIDVFSTLGPALTGSLGGMEGGLQAVSASLAQSLGDIMVNAGTTIVMVDKGFLALKSSLFSLGTGAGIGAGLLLIAAGSAMKSAASSFLSNPTGGGGSGIGGGPLSLRDYGDIARSRSDGGRVEVHLPPGPMLYDPNDYRQREAFKRMFRQLAGSREITFVEG